MAKKKASTRGKRYTEEEKKQIVDFANDHNSANGRGGAAAAARNFGISSITVGSWLKEGGETSRKRTSVKTAGGSRRRNISATLNELAKLDRQLSVKRKELAALEGRFEKLKAEL